MRQLALGLIAFVIGLGVVSQAVAQQASPERREVRQVFLVQNSGWMEPFYADPRSKFRLLISSLVAQSNLKGVDVVLATFNQAGQTPNPSPYVRYAGPYDKAALDEAIQSIDLPRKKNGAYTDADFHGALKNTITDVLNGGEGVIWMITNNKDSPSNSQTVVDNTRRFYTLLRTSPHITRIAAYPIRDDLSGPNFREKGFIIYAFAYGPRAAKALDVILKDGSATRALFRSPPVRIKPLDTNPVEVRLTSVSAGEVDARVKDGALEIPHVAGGKATVVRLQGVLRNTYYPQNIDHAAIQAVFRTADGALSKATVAIAPAAIDNVGALKDSQPISLTLTLPAVPRTGPFFGLLDEGRRIQGTLEIRLTDMAFSLDPEFVARISTITGAGDIKEGQARAIVAQQLPAVFLDYQRISSATTSVPVTIGVTHSNAPLMLIVFGVLLVLLVLIVLAIWAARARTYNVPVGGSQQSVTIRPFERRVVSDPYGTRARITGSLFGSPKVRTLAEDKVVER